MGIQIWGKSSTVTLLSSWTYYFVSFHQMLSYLINISQHTFLFRSIRNKFNDIYGVLFISAQINPFKVIWMWLFSTYFYSRDVIWIFPVVTNTAPALYCSHVLHLQVRNLNVFVVDLHLSHKDVSLVSWDKR